MVISAVLNPFCGRSFYPNVIQKHIGFEIDIEEHSFCFSSFYDPI